MIDLMRNTEIEYVKCFSEVYENERIMRFRDDSIPDMYSHNFTYIRGEMPDEIVTDTILEELELRKKEDKSFLQVETNFLIDKGILKSLPVMPEVMICDYMCISTRRYPSMGGNDDCRVREALTSKILQDGIRVDILANAPLMGEDFAARRIDRKAQIYRSPQSGLNLFVCYHNDIPIGNCELFINGSIAKIEDFDILEEYQKRGFGTSVLKYLLKHCEALGVQTAYLITDSEDTPKEMYSKCGFSKVGQKLTLLFNRF